MADEPQSSTSKASPPKKRSSPAKSGESPKLSPNVKRKRTQADRYQSDVVDAFSKTIKIKTPSSSKKEVFFGKGAYLAVRSEGGFFLCQTLKYVYDNSRTLSIQWLEETTKGVYKMSFLDFIDRESVLTQVQLRPAGEKGFKKLPENEISRIDKILNISVKKEKGQLTEADGRASLDELGEQLEKQKTPRKRSAAAATTTPKKPAQQTPGRKRKTPTATRSSATKQRPQSKTASRRSAPTRAKKKVAAKKGGRKSKKTEKKVKKGRAKQDPNSKLVPNNKVELLSKDPMFEVKNENKMPEVSKIVQCKRAIRAVLTNDMPLLKQLLANTKGVPSVFIKRSVAVDENAFGYAIKTNSHPFIRAFLSEMKSDAARCPMPITCLQKEHTGSYRYISLGHAVRNINVSRGGKEGNDAFIKDVYGVRETDRNIAGKLAEHGASIATIDLIQRERPSVKGQVMENIGAVVRSGNRKLAAELIKRSNESGGFGFNKLHEEVLTCDKPDELSTFRLVSVKKKPWTNDRLTPLHCAAINPNPKILEKLLHVVPEINLADAKGRKVIHYAAACTGSGPLECLLQRSVFADDTDNQGNTPLMVAASLNRTQNIEILAKKLKSEETGGVLRRNTFGHTPLHYAAQSGHNEAVRALLKHGASLQAPLSAGKNKLTPFMLACEHGHLATVKIMAESGAVLDQKDKLKRTPLMLAVMNGQVTVAAFLLRKGCDPNAKDSSGNTPLHYAAGYGWWYALQILLSAGADPNVLNDWKVPPLAIAFMKGHVGCADLLLQDPSVDVNFRDSDGWTIVMLTVGSPHPDMLEQLKYLIEEKHASPALKDANDWNALHHLAAAEVYSGPQYTEKRKISIDMASLLIARGCDLHAKTSDGETALDIAIKRPHYNADLVKFLLEKGSELTNFHNEQEENLLHLMAKRSLDSDQTELFNIIVENMKKEAAKTDSLPNDTGASASPTKDKFDLKELAQARDKTEYTPLLRWGQVYLAGMKNKNEESLERARAFLKCLLDEAESDVDAVLTAVDLTEKTTVVHMLCAVGEKPGKVIGTGEQSDFPALEEVLSCKPNLNLREHDGRTPLHIAINANSLSLAQRLVKAGADIALESHDEKVDEQATPLILALKKDLFDLVGVLLSSATVQAPSLPNKLTPIHYAVMSKHISEKLSVSQVIKKLLEKGANINVKDAQGRTPLHYACSTYILDNDPSTDVLELLVDNKADVFAQDSQGRLPLHYLFFDIKDANKHGEIDPIEAVSLMRTAMSSKQINHPDKRGCTPIHGAALRGAVISLMHLAESVSNVDMKDAHGNTPLSMATLGEHVSVVIFLLQKGANIAVNVTRPASPEPERKTDEDEEHYWIWKPMREGGEGKPNQDQTESLFRKVVKNGWQGILFLLMDRLEKCHVPYITPIKATIEEHRFQMALNLITKSRGQNISSLADKQQNLLHILALESVARPCNKVAEKLLLKGVGVGSDQFRCSPLTYAVLAENLDLCKLLWERMKQQDGKQILTSTDTKGRNLLAAAFWRQPDFDEDLVSWLVEVGSSLNVSCPLPLWALEGKVDDAVSSSRLQEYHTTTHPVGPLSPLVASVRVGNFSQVKFLLTKGADPNFAGKDALTPLMWAVKRNDIKMVKLLLNHSYDPEAQGKKSKTGSKKYRSLGDFGVNQYKRKQRGLVNGQDEDSESDEEDNDSEDDEDMEVDEDDEEEEEVLENGDKMETDESGKEAEKPLFEKTSSVDLSAKDAQGRTVVHHAMRACDYGTYQNVELLRLLCRLGAPVGTKDNEGKTPMDYALETRSDLMAAEIQKAQGEAKPQITLPAPRKATWTDGCDWSGQPGVDFKEDSRKLMDRLQQETQDKDQETPKYPKPLVDSAAELREAGEVLMDTEQDIPYDVLLTKADVKYGMYGMNNFYKMQVVHVKGKDMYVLLTRWGRVGDAGQYQRTPFNNKEDAVAEFSKIFKAKSGNQWSHVKEFSRMHGKYNLVRTDPYFDRRAIKKVEFDLKSPKPSKLPKGTQELLKTLTCPDMLKHALKQCGASERFLPFGRLQRDVIDQASTVLQKIQGKLKELEEPDLSLDKRQDLHDEIAELSSEFYMLVPNDSFTYQAMGPIADHHSVEQALQDLADMADLEFSGNLMLGAQQKVADMNPLDYIYRSLDCEIEALSEDDVESQLILQQIHNTQLYNDIHVQRIYRMRRKDEEDTLTSCGLTNHRLLWHGTKPFNILSILKRGMLVTPIGAPITGFRFGTGIYHADMFAKSYEYTAAYNFMCKSKFLFLNEVALGNTLVDKGNAAVEKLLKSHDSLKSCGTDEPDPAQDLLLPSGAVLPLGLVNHEGSDHNEFVVYKESQTCLRYLVQIKA